MSGIKAAALRAWYTYASAREAWRYGPQQECWDCGSMPPTPPRWMRWAVEPKRWTGWDLAEMKSGRALTQILWQVADSDDGVHVASTGGLFDSEETGQANASH